MLALANAHALGIIPTCRRRKFLLIASTCATVCMARRVVMIMGAVATAMAINPGASSHRAMFNQIRTCFGRIATALAIYPGTSCCRLLLCQQTRSRLFHAFFVQKKTLDFFQCVCFADDHWEFSKKLTVDNYKEFIQSEIDAGRTLFVRWIAYSG